MTTNPLSRADCLWKQIPSHPMYQVNNEGDVLSPSGHFVKPYCNYGYLVVQLWSDNKVACCRVQRLVMAAFVGPCPSGKEVAHWDGNKLNNHISNLRYATAKENYEDRVRHGRVRIGENHHSAKFTVSEIRDIRANYTPYSPIYSAVKLASYYQVSTSAIHHIVRRESWKRC